MAQILRKDMIAAYPELSAADIQCLIAQRKPHVDFSDKITPYAGNSEWEQSCKKNSWWAKNYIGTLDNRCKQMLKLRDLLLSKGGCEACLPVMDEDLMNIIAYGQLWDNNTTRMMKGRPSQCHSNSAELWYNNKYSYKNGHAVIICTGYALSSDGFWRQHSWLVHAKSRANVIIETTKPRVAYFGFGMTYAEAEQFEYDNS